MYQSSSKKKLKINSYQSSSEKDFIKKKENNFMKANTETEINFKIKKKKNYFDFRKKDYIISIDNVFNKLKEKVKLKQSKLFNKTKFTEISNNKNISKEKTMNNTFNTYNTNSNTNINNNNNQNSNSNNTYINIAINNSKEDQEISKNEEDINNINNIKNIDIKSKKIKLITFNDFDKSDKKFSDSNDVRLNTMHEYYSTKDKIKELDQLQKKLFLSSTQFYLHNKQRGIKRKIKQIKNKDIEKELKQIGYNFTDKKKINIYSDLKKLPTKICFGKSMSSMIKEDEDKEIYENKFLKNLENKCKENQINTENFRRLMTKGFSDSRKNINKYDAVLENKLVKNSNSKKIYKKKNQIITGQNLYPLLTTKKILKNILPKEIDYNTQFTINDVINDELHPLYRYQKKNLNFHSGLISHEINYLFVKTFALGKMADKRKDIINKKMDEKFNILSKILFEKEDEVIQAQKKLSAKQSVQLIRRKYLLDKFESAIKRSFYQFRRMKININKFLEITRYDIPIKLEEGLFLFKAIKDGDVDNIERIVKSNYNYALFKDEFGQTAIHMCAKRNVYQVIQLLISRLGNVDAQDIYGRTPLMCAAENKHLEVISVLLLNYADPNIQDNYGKRAIDYIDKGIRSKTGEIEYKIKRTLKFIRVVYLFNKMMVNEKDFDSFVRNSINYLFKDEFDIDFEELLRINDEVLSDEKQKKYY